MPLEMRQLSPELAKVDQILDDDRFLAPYRRRFSKRIGRPTIPLDTFLRLMYLKFRYGLGYETLVREVADSVMWRRFCRIPLNQLPPRPTTLIKLVKRCGPETLRELNELLVQNAREEKLIRGRKLRVDTTVLPADIRYPADAGLEPAEFGYKVALQEVENGIVSGYEVAQGNPPDEKLLPVPVKRHERQFARPPKELAADRGFSNRRQERELEERGIEHVCIPYRGNKSAARKVFERQAWFRRLAGWRAGCEGRISLLKRKFGRSHNVHGLGLVHHHLPGRSEPGIPWPGNRVGAHRPPLPSGMAASDTSSVAPGVRATSISPLGVIPYHALSGPIETR
ncbi:MAG: transposase [Bacillota bacterium]|nr:transposase [Bacillota bacterium]